MSGQAEPWTIIGQGLAGTCLAWMLHRRGIGFVAVDRGHGGSSRPAAGMVNPVTGKNFEPSWRIADFLPEALEFYADVEREIGCRIWHPFPVLRLAASAKEWGKIVSKLSLPEVSPWIAGEVKPPAGWAGAVLLSGGGRLDTRAFLDGSRRFFEDRGCHRTEDFCKEAAGPRAIHCEGAAGLMAGDYGPHRCAKGEILTIRAEGWDEEQIRIGAGGWMVPQGGGVFRVGATYEWHELDELPTAKGRLRIEEIATRLGGEIFEVIDHVAGIRPILRRSQPLIGPMPDGSWMFNALGSKGSLYAPGMARRLADWIAGGAAPEAELDIRNFLASAREDESR